MHHEASATVEIMWRHVDPLSTSWIAAQLTDVCQTAGGSCAPLAGPGRVVSSLPSGGAVRKTVDRRPPFLDAHHAPLLIRLICPGWESFGLPGVKRERARSSRVAGAWRALSPSLSTFHSACSLDACFTHQSTSPRLFLSTASIFYK